MKERVFSKPGFRFLEVCSIMDKWIFNLHYSKNKYVGCVILPKVLELISDVDFPIPLPMNKSPSEKKSNLFHF